MDKETLSNYGWIVICVLVLAVMIALATPFGTFVAGAIKSTTAGLFGVNQNALGAAGITIGDQVFENCEHLETELRNVTDTYTGDTCCKACGAVLQAGQTVRPKVPEGGKYTAADGTVYNPGDEMPEIVTTGDVYVFGNYEYRYNQYKPILGSNWGTNETYNGWGVRCKNNVADPGPILETINGRPITSLNGTFYKCSNITIAPAIPQTVIDLHETFDGCSSLTNIDNIVIPSGVTSMQYTFGSCIKLTDLSDFVIPISVTNMEGTFRQCNKLTVAPAIPANVKYINNLFLNCYSLKSYAGSTDPDGDFSDFVIHNQVSSLSYTFQGCKSITSAPVIPTNIKYMDATFSGCSGLTGTIEVNATLSRGSNCFSGVDFEAQNITLTGSTDTHLDTLGATGTNYCAECNGKCQGNH